MSKKLVVISPNKSIFAIKDIGGFDNSTVWWDKWNDVIRNEPQGWDTYRKINRKAIVIDPSQMQPTPLKSAGGSSYFFVKMNHSEWIGYIVREDELINVEIPSEMLVNQ